MEFKIGKENISNTTNIHTDIKEDKKIRKLQILLTDTTLQYDKIKEENDCLHRQQNVLVSLLNQKESQINITLNRANIKLLKTAQSNTDHIIHKEQEMQYERPIKEYKSNSTFDITNQNNVAIIIKTDKVAKQKNKLNIHSNQKIRAPSHFLVLLKSVQINEYNRSLFEQHIEFKRKKRSGAVVQYGIKAQTLSYIADSIQSINMHTNSTSSTMEIIAYQRPYSIKYTSEKIATGALRKSKCVGSLTVDSKVIDITQVMPASIENIKTDITFENQGAQTNSNTDTKLFLLLQCLFSRRIEMKIGFYCIKNNALCQITREKTEESGAKLMMHSINALQAKNIKLIIERLKRRSNMQSVKPLTHKSVASKYITLSKSRDFKKVKANSDNSKFIPHTLIAECASINITCNEAPTKSTVEIASLQTENTKLVKMSNDIQTKCNNLEAELTQSKEDNIKFDSKLKQSQQRQSEVVTAYDQVLEQYKKLESECQNSAKELLQNEALVRESQHKCEEYQMTINQLMSKLKAVSTKYSDMLEKQVKTTNNAQSQESLNIEIVPQSEINEGRCEQYTLIQKVHELEEQNMILLQKLEANSMNTAEKNENPQKRMQYAQKYNESQEKIEEYEEHIRELNIQITALNEECKKQRDKEDDIEESLRQANEHNQLLTNELHEKNEAIERFTELNNTLIQEQKRNQEELSNLNLKANIEKDNREIAEAELQSLKGKSNVIAHQFESNRTMNSAVSSLTSDKKLLVEQLEIAAKDIKNLKNSYVKQLEYSKLADNKIEMLEIQITEHKLCNSKIQELMSQVENLKKEKTSIEKQYRSANASNKKITTARKTKAEKEKSMDIIIEDMDDIERTRVKCQQLREVNSKLQSSIIEKNSLIDKLKQQNNDVTKELLDITNEVTHLRHKAKETDEKIRKATEERAKMTDNETNYKKMIEEMSTEIEQKVNAEKESASLLERKYELIISKEKGESLKQIETLKRECSSLKSRIEELSRESIHAKELSQAEYSNLKSQMVINQQSISASEKEKAILMQKITQMQREYDKIKEQLEAMKRSIEYKDKELEEFKQNCTKNKGELEKAFEELENYAKILEKLETKVSNMQRDKDDAMKQK